MNEKIVLIDGHSILNRAFYGVPDLTNSTRQPFGMRCMRTTRGRESPWRKNCGSRFR